MVIAVDTIRAGIGAIGRMCICTNKESNGCDTGVSVLHGIDYLRSIRPVLSSAGRIAASESGQVPHDRVYNHLHSHVWSHNRALDLPGDHPAVLCLL